MDCYGVATKDGGLLVASDGVGPLCEVEVRRLGDHFAPFGHVGVASGAVVFLDDRENAMEIGMNKLLVFLA